MKLGLFRRTSVKCDECSEIISAHYTDDRGIQFDLTVPEGENHFYLELNVTKPFNLLDRTKLNTGDLDDAFEVAAIYIQELFTTISTTLNITSEALMSQVGKEW